MKCDQQTILLAHLIINCYNKLREENRLKLLRFHELDASRELQFNEPLSTLFVTYKVYQN